MTLYQRSVLQFLAFLVVFQGVVIFAVDLRRPAWHDEGSLVRTAQRFGEEISIDLLTSYDQMSTPLPFVIYALWGRLVGFDLWQLRILSIIIALVTYLLWHRILFLRLKDRWAVSLLAVFLVVHPYMVGFSIFVFTDMLSILFILLTVHAVISHRPVQLGLALAGALLCRQYAAFLTLAAVVFYVLMWLSNRDEDRGSRRLLIATLLSGLPYGCLVLLWGGVSPLNKWRGNYLEQGLYFHPEMLTLYLCLITIYLAPLIVYGRRWLYSSRRDAVVGLAISFLYWVFPIRASMPAVEIDVHTVGIFHRLLVHTLGYELAIDILFQLALFLSLPFLFRILTQIYRGVAARLITPALFLDISIVSFLLIMPFSYLGWEKYFMPLLPIVALRMVDPVCQSNNRPLPQEVTEISKT